MSMNLARWRRETLWLARRSAPKPRGTSVADILRYIQGDDSDIRAARSLALLRQSGKRRRPVLRCKTCPATIRDLPPRNMAEALVNSRDGWCHALLFGWQCPACLKAKWDCFTWSRRGVRDDARAELARKGKR